MQFTQTSLLGERFRCQIFLPGIWSKEITHSTLRERLCLRTTAAVSSREYGEQRDPRSHQCPGKRQCASNIQRSCLCTTQRIHPGRKNNTEFNEIWFMQIKLRCCLSPPCVRTTEFREYFRLAWQNTGSPSEEGQWHNISETFDYKTRIPGRELGLSGEGPRTGRGAVSLSTDTKASTQLRGRDTLCFKEN